MYGGNPQGTNFIPFADPPQGIIERVIDVGSGVRSGAAVADGIVYIGGQSRVVAFETATGRQIWERKVSGPAHGVPAITRDTLYLGTLNKNVIALDRGSGQPRWEYQGDSPFPGSVTVHNGIVYAGSRGGEIHALDAESGKALWEVGLGSAAVAPVAVQDGRLYASSNAGVLFSRHARTGDKRARIRTGAALVAPPVVADGRVFLISEGDLMAFDGGTRELPGRYPAELVWAQLWIWRFPLPAPPEHSGLLWRFSPDDEMGAFLHRPAVTREALYLGTDEGEIVALRPEDGSVLWRMQPASELRRVDGNLWWRMPTGGPAAAPPLVAGDLLIVAHEDGALRAINRYTQEGIWELSLNSPVAAPLSFAAGRVYAHTQDGRLHIIK
jgi:outer membrane protein assembly factor BamB